MRAPAGQMPFIAKIESVKNTPEGKTVKVAWFYRPEEAYGGRKVCVGIAPGTAGC